MRGLCFAGDRTMEFLDVPDPTPGPGEVVLEMKASGMCGSDLKIYRAKRGEARIARVENPQPVIGGHEPCGVVAAVGPGVHENEARVGARVMVHHYWGCTVCDSCRTGWAQLCSNEVPKVYGISDHGGHAPYMKVPARTLVPLPDSLSFEAGAAISCGTGTAFGALHRADLKAEETIAVIGQGPVGLSATQLAAAMGARVIAVDINEKRLEHARRFGAEVTLNPMKCDAVEAIRDMTNGRGVELAVETSGAVPGRETAFRSLAIWGRLCLVAGGPGGLPVDNLSEIVTRQITIIGTWTFSNVGQAHCARFVAQRNIPVDEVFTHRWKLEQGNEAYRLFDQQNEGKGVFVM